MPSEVQRVALVTNPFGAELKRPAFIAALDDELDEELDEDDLDDLDEDDPAESDGDAPAEDGEDDADE